MIELLIIQRPSTSIQVLTSKSRTLLPQNIQNENQNKLLRTKFINIFPQQQQKIAARKTMSGEKKDQRIQHALMQFTIFQNNIRDCENLIKKECIGQAISQLLELIKSNQFLDAYPFRAIGNLQNWQLRCPRGPYQWFETANISGEVTGNPFDLLNFCFILQLENKAMTFSDVLSEYSKMANKKRNLFQIEVGLGNIYYQQELYLKAEDHYLKAIEWESQCEKALQSLAWIHHKFNNHKEALNYARKVKNINPENQQAQLLGILNQKGDLFFTMVEQLESLALKYPQYYRIYLQLAGSCEKYSQAKKWIDKALQFQSSPKTKYEAFSLRLEFKEDDQNLQQQLTKELEECECWEYHNVMVLLKEQQKNEEKMMEEFQKVIAMRPNSWELLETIGYKLIAMKEYNKAIEYFSRAEQLNPYNPSISNSLGYAYSFLGEQFKQKEKNCYHDSIQKSDEYYLSFCNLGHWYGSQGQLNQAIQMFARAYQINPNNHESLIGLYRCYRELNLDEEAEEKMEQVLARGDSKQRLEMYNIVANQMIGEEEHELALKYLLKCQNQKMNCRLSQQIITFLINIDYAELRSTNDSEDSQIRTMLQTVAAEENRSRDNVYAILQLAMICDKYLLKKESAELYRTVKDIHKSDYVSDEVEQALLTYENDKIKCK